MRPRDPSELTRILGEMHRGGGDAIERLVHHAGPKLHAMAIREFRRSGVDRWLSQATQFVDDVFLRIVREARANWINREQFFATCRQMLRQEMADVRRGQLRVKRGAGRRMEPLCDSAATALPDPWTPLVVAEALGRLRMRGGESARSARAVELVHLEGMSQAAAATRLGVSRRMIQGDLDRAFAWLRRELDPM